MVVPLGGLKRRNAIFSKNHWLQRCSSASYYSWAGYAFESICQKEADKILSGLGIDGIEVKIATWRKAAKDGKLPGAQIDLILDRSDRVINLCEIKYSRDPIVIDKKLKDSVLTKQNIFMSTLKKQRTILPILIAANGVKNIYTGNLTRMSPFVKVLTLKDLF